MIPNTHPSTLVFKKGSYILVEDKEDPHFFIIQEGKVQLSRKDEVVKERDGHVFGPGEFFGVVAAMSNHSHIETARAITDVTLTAIPASQFDAFIQNNTLAAMHIMAQFSNRMRYLTKGLTQLTLNDSAEEDRPEDLFAVGRFYEESGNLSHAHYAYGRYLAYCPQGEHARDAGERMAAFTPHGKAVPYTIAGNKKIYAADTVLYAQGEPAEELYVIQSGSVKITKIVNNSEILLAILKAGDFVGEMAILESKPRSVTAVTYEECALLAVSKETFPQVAASNPQIISRLIRTLADKIWFLYRHLANTDLIDPVARMYDALFIQIEKNRIPVESTGDYTFSFSLKELVSMTGMNDIEVEKAVEKIESDPDIELTDDKIHIRSVAAITKQRNYYKSIEWRKKAFRISHPDMY
ncbi:MAG: cyclic nucleotide-binding domain-containing protein [Spirochaetaceae bacterium]|jgi:CRP-like cAMP-binding protein|nr:cyclic nucleotide-binding domain-containing protein [Spirochaetaceae bacterium]